MILAEPWHKQNTVHFLMHLLMPSLCRNLPAELLNLPAELLNLLVELGVCVCVCVCVCVKVWHKQMYWREKRCLPGERA